MIDEAKVHNTKVTTSSCNTLKLKSLTTQHKSHY
jgi:hypothetical protein